MRRLEVLVIGFLLTTAGATSAQDTSRSEFSGGWRYYHTTLSGIVRPIQVQGPNKNYPKGWYADAAANLSPKFAIVGEAGGTYFSDDFSSTAGTLVIKESLDIKFHTFMGGARVRAPQIPWFVPFGQVLFGGEHDTSSDERTLTIGQNTTRNRQDRSSSNAALALDSGATIAFGRIGVRASAGYVRMFSTADADAFRFSLGAAFRF
jgi:hypothetical protein